jgi:hypothetical protein
MSHLKTHIKKVHGWAQGSHREDWRVLPCLLIALFFHLGIPAFQLKRFVNGEFGEVKVSKTLNPKLKIYSCIISTAMSSTGCHFETV